jgi:hypothetical protein
MISSKAAQPSYASPAAFPVEAQEVLRRLRRAIAEMFDSVPGGIGKSRDVQKLFGVSTKLSWQIFKLAGPGDALSLAPHVPKEAAMRRVLEGAEKYGVPARLINEVRTAYSAFEALIETHAGDRASFESMAVGLSGSSDTGQADVQHRKAIFRGHSHFYGAQVETRVITHFMHPSGEPDRYDLAALRSKFGLRRLRADAEVVVDSIRMYPPPGTDAVHWGYIDQEMAERYGAPILPPGCSEPVPPLHTRQGPLGRTYFELADDVLGQRGAVNLSFGQVLCNTVLSPSDDGRTKGWLVLTHTLTPAACLIADMLVHRQTMPRLTHEVNIYGHANQAQPYEIEQTYPRLPFREQITKLEAGIDGARIHGTPQYIDLLRYVCEHRGWHLDDFDVYRLKIEFPLLDSLVAMRFDLPPRG